MQYTVTSDFIKLAETTGTIQNTSNIFSIEVSDKAQPNSGIFLHPLNKFSFYNQSLYVRCVEGGRAAINVVPFLVDAGFVTGSASAVSTSDSFNDDDLNDIFKP